MSLTDHKITYWENPISDLPDSPQLSADAMKTAFDSNSNELKTSVNGIITELTSTAGAGQIGSAPITGVTGTTIWAQLSDFFTNVFGVIGSYFDLTSASSAYRARISHGGTKSYFGIKTTASTPVSQVELSAQASGTFLQINNASGDMRGMLGTSNVDSTSSLWLSNADDAIAKVGNTIDQDESVCGLWLTGSDYPHTSLEMTHRVTAGTCSLAMGYGTSPIYQVVVESTSGGGRIILRGAAGAVGAELVIDPTAGGQIKLYDAAGTIKQTIG